MDNQVIDNQQQPQEAPKPAYNPLMDNVNEKPYSVQNVSVSQEQMTNYIPEPTYQPQAVGGRENPYAKIREQSGTMSSGSGGSQAPPPINPTLKELPEAEKKEGAKYVAKVIMDVYEQVHVWVNGTLPISQKKLRKYENEGKIDLSMPVNDGQGNVVTAGNIIAEFNHEVKDSLSVDPKWKKETMPILEEVLAKRGAAMTAEQMLLFQFGKDIGIKGMQYIGIKKQQDEIFNLLMDLKERYDDAGGEGYVPPQPKAQPKPEQRTEEPYAYAPSEPQVDVNSDRFNFESNETVMASTVETMRVPQSGKARSIAQRQKEKKWRQDAEEAATRTPSAYELAMNERKTGKRGRKKSVAEYVASVDKDEIVDALILSETKNSDLPKDEPTSE